MLETDMIEVFEFIWGKKRGFGGKNKDIQFYESFTYDGVEYVLFDCVYLYKEGEPEPYIGKLTKLWEMANKKKTKKVKVLWFFRPCEILHYIGGAEVQEKELFLASGEGAGLANINPLESIAGKCNVLCVAKDSRNPQPSDEELQVADYIFYRTFDVGLRKVMDKIDDNIAGIDVKFIFNRAVEKPLYTIDASNKEANKKDMASYSTAVLSEQNLSEGHTGVKRNEKGICVSPNEVADTNVPLAMEKTSCEQNPALGVGIESREKAKKNQRQEYMSGYESLARFELESDIREGKGDKVMVRKAESKRKVKCAKDLLDSDRPSKKAKINDSVKVPEGKKKNTFEKLRLNSDGNDTKTSAPSASTVDHTFKPLSSKHALGADKGSIKKLKPGEKTRILSNGNSPKASPRQSENADCKNDGQELVVTRRPDVDKKRWFKGLPWEDTMKMAHEQGRLVLLDNLDPNYTSADVEDIVWHAFKETCKAKMIQRTAFSSPHSGKAIVIFKKTETAEMVVRKLAEGCLLLSNERPLVGRIGVPCLPEKKPSFFGHLVIDKLRYQMQRGMKDAVSTSHCSQPNTIEYDMAMEWCLLQERFDFILEEVARATSQGVYKTQSQIPGQVIVNLLIVLVLFFVVHFEWKDPFAG